MPEYLLLEDDASHLLLEDASGALLLETSGVIPTPPGVAVWTFVLTDASSGDELCDLTGAVLSAKISPRLNRPLTVALELPADNADIRATAADGDPNLVVGTRSIKAYRNGTLRANVLVWQISYDGDADTAKVSVTGYDPLVQLRRRPARDDTGDFSNPEFGDDTPAGELVQGIIDTSTTYDGAGLLIDTGGGLQRLDDPGRQPRRLADHDLRPAHDHHRHRRRRRRHGAARRDRGPARDPERRRQLGLRPERERQLRLRDRRLLGQPRPGA